jgi:diadenosine tetraphosphatase ApaH/serine/threonine PP2A family protein phosphatase
MEIDIPNNWEPRSDQMKLWSYLENGGKRAVEVAHRRWGKDDVALHFTATAAQERVGNYWHMLPKYDQARKTIWDAINPKTGKKRIDEAFPEQIRKRTNQQAMLIEFKTGSMWQLVGSDNFNSIVGSPPIGIVLSEWAIANPMAWAYLAPILEENGGWALFIYTSRGNNHGKTTYEHALNKEGWFAEKLPATYTPVFSGEQLENIKQEYINIFGQELGIAMFNQEYLCSWEGAVLGAYLAAQISQARLDGRITNVPHRTGIEVDTFWDLGIDDSMAIWFMQPVGQSYNFIDYYKATGYGLEHYSKLLKSKPYIYGNHYMPHDVEQREMTNSEVAKSRREVAEDLGIKPVQTVQRARNMDTIIQVHIPACRNILAQCWFDAERCQAGISALENFRAKYDEKQKVLQNRYLHDWSSHGASAFRTFAVGWEGLKEKLVVDKGLPLSIHSQSAGLGWMGG